MAENNLIKNADLARAREIDFVSTFSNGSVKKLLEVLDVTKMIPKQAGTTLKAYTAVGQLEDGAVPEGDTIPLSKYTTEPVPFGELILNKWRKATSAEAIIEKGYDQAVTMINDRMLRDVQKGIRTRFFNFLATGTGTAFRAAGIDIRIVVVAVGAGAHLDFHSLVSFSFSWQPVPAAKYFYSRVAGSVSR